MEDINKIIKRCLAGKRAYQRKLYDMFSDKMFGLCLQYTKDYGEAQDVLQDSFIRIFKNLKQFNNKGSFEGWVRRIIINTAIERYRKKNYLYQLEEEIAYYDDIAYDNVLSEMSVDDIMTFIKNLSPQYKMVFNLYAIEGYSHSEISKMLNISEGTSKSNLSRARNILQDKIKKYCGVKEKIG